MAGGGHHEAVHLARAGREAVRVDERTAEPIEGQYRCAPGRQRGRRTRSDRAEASSLRSLAENPVEQVQRRRKVMS